MNHVKYIGVTLSSNANFNGHYKKNVLCAANQLCDWVLRTFNTGQTHNINVASWGVHLRKAIHNHWNMCGYNIM